MPTINKRIEALENKKNDLPVVVVWEDLETPGLWKVNDEKMTWSEFEKRYLGRDIVKVIYIDDWRGKEF